MAEARRTPPFINMTMKLILSSPLHGIVSKNILLISFKGRKSGKTYSTPVDYAQDGDTVYILSRADWWKNLRGGAPVTLRMRGKEYHGLADAVSEDKQAIADGMAAFLRQAPIEARFYGVKFDEHGNPRAEDVQKASEKLVLVRVRLA